ncbi:MAG: 50S ribosomal protein L5 [Halobacteriota archaeon]|nr:50S ribosomal protein L5 [Halobacteriota archaeon]
MVERMSNENPMRKPRLDKVVINMGVGEGGQRLVNAEKILETIVEQTPVRTYVKKTAFDVRKGEPIGCKVTLRGVKGEKFLGDAFEINEKRLRMSSFDDTGNFSFGIAEHTDFSGMKYDPNIGIFGMDICVSLKRPGYRTKDRKIQKRRVPNNHRLTVEDAVKFIQEEYGVVIEE